MSPGSGPSASGRANRLGLSAAAVPAMRPPITALPAGLARNAGRLSDRPRGTHGYMTPSENLAELHEHTG
jgi:hypothetical protein